MKKISLLFAIQLLFHFAHAQTGTPALFDEDNFTKISQVADSENASRYIILLRSNLNAAYTLKKEYLDSACKKLLSKSFYKADILDGPFTIYQDTLLGFQGTYKNGKWDGERKAYLNGQLRNKSFFNNGMKTGTWEEYSAKGILIRRIIYDVNGIVSSDIKY